MAAKAKLTPEQQLKKSTEKKVTTIVRTIRQLRAVAKYQPTPQQRDKVFAAIKAELESAHAAWSNPKTAVKQEGFTL